MPKRDPLELFVEEELGDLLGLRLTSGSGNQLGDGDLKPKAIQIDRQVNLGFECKRTTKSKNHLVSWNDYQKAKAQIERGGNTPVMVTQNSLHNKMVHLSFEDFKHLLELLAEAGYL